MFKDFKRLYDLYLRMQADGFPRYAVSLAIGFRKYVHRLISSYDSMKVYCFTDLSDLSDDNSSS